MHMTDSSHTDCWLRLSVILLLLSVQSAFAQTPSVRIIEEFGQGWQQNWLEREPGQLPESYDPERALSDRPRHYGVEHDHDEQVLRIYSNDRAVALWRTIPLSPLGSGIMAWRWKVDTSLEYNKRERQKIGDDYAARVIVVFEPQFTSWKTRAIAYVWAGREPKDQFYRNPYSNSVGTIVVESGNDLAGKWVEEKRNLVSDHVRIFGKMPEFVSAVAIMVDTDNTHSRTTAWFDDIILRIWSPVAITAKPHAR